MPRRGEGLWGATDDSLQHDESSVSSLLGFVSFRNVEQSRWVMAQRRRASTWANKKSSSREGSLMVRFRGDPTSL